MTAVNYLWNPINDNIVEEFDDDGNTIAEYTTEPDMHGDVISQYRDGQENFYHSDGQGSTLALSNSAGDVTDTYAYNAFGEVTERTGNTVNPFQFVGQYGYYQDYETGSCTVRRRDYDAKWSRWLAIDPIEEPSVVAGLYSYVHNCPTNNVDPSGLLPFNDEGVVTETCAAKKACAVTTLEREKGKKCPADYTPYTFVLIAGGKTTTKDMCGKCVGGEDCKENEKCTFDTRTKDIAGTKFTEAFCECVA